MMPYTSLDMLLAMQRELSGQARDLAEADVKGPTSSARREPLPDPLGRALVALRPIETVRAGAARLVALGRGSPSRAA
jgi:hypothetical protein